VIAMPRSTSTGWRGALSRWWAGIAGREDRGAPAEATHSGPPRDRGSHEPLGPVTPDSETPAGDTSEAHDEISPHDLPAGHPGRPEAERLAGDEPGGTTQGNR
jgi:hypothetical protein